MWHPRMLEFDHQMKALFDEVDHYLEDHYGDKYELHPVRPARGETSNPEADGLFNIGVDFSPGFGSELGRGYIIRKKMSTLDKVDPAIREEIYEAAVNKVRELLPLHFPDRELSVNRDKNHYKIQGDFSLGKI